MQINFKSEKFKGLTETEAQGKLISSGYNELPASKPKSIVSIALGVIKEPMFLLLVGSGTLYLILGDIHEGILLLAFVFLIMGIEFYQEKKTENALNALRDLASPQVLVVRNEEKKRIPGREIVPGDIFILHEGDRVPADASVLSCINLTADESLLTGESIPVRKSEWTGAEPIASPGGDDLPFVYSGSMIVQGKGLLKAVSTGMNTEIGKIGKAIDSISEEPTRLKQEIGKLVSNLAIIGIVLCAILIAVYVYIRGGLLNGFLVGITLAMSILPEEIPVIFTVFLAIGAFRMSKQNVLTRNTSAVESLGSATVLCTDKTGTLTRNQMSVSMLYDGKDSVDVHAGGELPESFKDILTCGILSSQINPFDPMEKAIAEMGCKEIHDDWTLVKEYPLTRDLMVMSRVCEHNKNRHRIIASKGAPEAIFDICHLDESQKSVFSKVAETFATQGLRVLGVAKNLTQVEALPDIQQEFDFKFIGLIGLSDPIRENVSESVSECRKAGIRVIMITGDYPVTAMNIARDIGLENPDSVISGQDLEAMSDDELSTRINEVNVFARVVPDQKLKIVNALKKNNEIVAMTGDGVNDAPALKASDIGIAMGQKGTDVARESSDLVLMDDNFSSIVAAIKMGRRIFDNLQKALAYTFAIHVPITGIALIPVFSKHLPLILWPVHVVFLEMIIDPACSIIFEAEPEETNVMDHPPKPIDEPFFGKGKILMSCIQGLFILASVLAVYFFGVYSGYPEREIRSLTFSTLIFSNIAIILSNRSWSRNVIQIIMTPNNSVKWVIGFAIFFLALVLNVPFLRDVFQFDKISVLEAGVCCIAGFSSIIWFEIYKHVKLNRKMDS
jgi:Ca2+-transporting ATPase